MAASLTDLDLLATFVEIYRGGSLTAAATRRGLTQPAVSGQLAKLEKELGEQLFIRGSRGVTATLRADELARRVGPHLDHRHSRSHDLPEDFYFTFREFAQFSQ